MSFAIRHSNLRVDGAPSKDIRLITALSTVQSLLGMHAPDLDVQLTTVYDESSEGLVPALQCVEARANDRVVPVPVELRVRVVQDTLLWAVIDGENGAIFVSAMLSYATKMFLHRIAHHSIEATVAWFFNEYLADDTSEV